MITFRNVANKLEAKSLGVVGQSFLLWHGPFDVYCQQQISPAVVSSACVVIVAGRLGTGPVIKYTRPRRPTDSHRSVGDLSQSQVHPTALYSTVGKEACSS